MKVADKDGNGTIDASDRYILGHCAPSWTGSINSSLQWKNIDFAFSIYTSQGGYVYSPFMREFGRYGSRGTQHIKLPKKCFKTLRIRNFGKASGF